MGFDIVEHLANLDVRTAMPGALECAHCGGNRRIRIGSRRGNDTGRKRRVVTAAMLGMDNQAPVEQLGFGIGIVAVRPDEVQDISPPSSEPGRDCADT